MAPMVASTSPLLPGDTHDGYRANKDNDLDSYYGGYSVRAIRRPQARQGAERLAPDPGIGDIACEVGLPSPRGTGDFTCDVALPS